MKNFKEPLPKTAAAVKSGVVASLIEDYLDRNADFKASLTPGGYALTLRAPGIERKISLAGDRESGVLWFPRHEDMISLLSGKKGLLVPILRQLSFLSALKAFQRCAGAVGQAMEDNPGVKETERVKAKLPLLLTAALRGVAEVYNYDHWTAMKSSHIPEGLIGVSVEDDSSLGGFLEVRAKRMVFMKKGYAEGANAQLVFADSPICYQVLTGSLPAMAALGDGRVILRGRLPMIQGLFPLLDRFGEMMS